MSDTTGAIPSPIEPVVDRDRRWTTVWYPWIKRLLETVKSSATAVFEVQTTVDQINGQWGVSINANNRVIGAVKLDASTLTSTFGILADKFIVVHPSNNATEIQAFIVGLVNGISTVEIGRAHV